ncbi:hypothetical protein [Vibrio penaeicida]|uniref:Uncharacterized protein n=1 Tax=Vibrio penaeicida TaxID=104609 RepID=A0AAV5NVE0_9VIBR|nr:hypothetical protein [Vibrio penaeicida]RTZ19143.1 hypothetical protein EKN09_28230 [Vibrio penaeicida]GLQ74239.1 hypothetical protein GCM10007932_36000 [Vibrio penaeicida]
MKYKGIIINYSSFPTQIESFPASYEKRDNAPLVVASTKMKIIFKEVEELNACLEELLASDERLLSIPNSEAMYDWQQMIVMGNEIRFGVVWYNEEFFENKKDIYIDPMHSRMLQKFGVSSEDYEVNHYKLVA